MRGRWAGICCSALIRDGLFTRLCGLAGCGFVVLAMSLHDLYGHQTMGSALGQWFDPPAGRDISDQRALGCLLCWYGCWWFKGGGRVALDVFLWRAPPPGALLRRLDLGLGRVIPAEEKSSPAGRSAGVPSAAGGRPKSFKRIGGAFASSRPPAMWWNACSPVLRQRRAWARPAPRGDHRLGGHRPAARRAAALIALRAGIAVFSNVVQHFSSHFFGFSYVLGIIVRLQNS